MNEGLCVSMYVDDNVFIWLTVIVGLCDSTALQAKDLLLFQTLLSIVICNSIIIFILYPNFLDILIMHLYFLVCNIMFSFLVRLQASLSTDICLCYALVMFLFLVWFICLYNRFDTFVWFHLNMFNYDLNMFCWILINLI